MDSTGRGDKCPPPVVADEEARMRTLLIEKRDGSFGFSIQSYGIQYRRDAEVEIITYIDQVDPTGPAEEAGMREGDVILSINGQDMESCNHQALISSIRQCPDSLRMDVMFEDCVRKVRLHMRYIQLQRQLTERMYALEQLGEQEKHFMSNLRAQGRAVPSSFGGPSSAGRSSLLNSAGRHTRRSHSLAASSAALHRKRYRRPPPHPQTHPQVSVWRPAQRGLSWDHISCQLVYSEGRCCCRCVDSDERRRLLCGGSRTARSAESLLSCGGPGGGSGGGSSQFDTSCFSCECLLGALTISALARDEPRGPPPSQQQQQQQREQQHDRQRRSFFKPKSMDNLLAAGFGAVRRVDKMRQKVPTRAKTSPATSSSSSSSCRLRVEEAPLTRV